MHGTPTAAPAPTGASSPGADPGRSAVDGRSNREVPNVGIVEEGERLITELQRVTFVMNGGVVYLSH